VVAGRAVTTRQILIYSLLLLLISILLCVLGFASIVLRGAASVCWGILIAITFQSHAGRGTDRRAAQRLFGFSIVHLFVLFAARLLSSIDTRWLSTLLPRAQATFTSCLHAYKTKRAGLRDNTIHLVGLHVDGI